MDLFNQRSIMLCIGAFSLALLAVGFSGEKTHSDALNLEVRLIWGTNDKESPDSKHKPIDTPLTRELAKRFAWKNYFEVNRKELPVALNEVGKVALSEKCSIEVKNLGGSRVEVKLFGRGKFVSKTAETIPKGKWLALAGDSEGTTVWFVVLKTIPSVASRGQTN